MSADLLARQGHLKRSIERSLENFKKLGRANFTAAKIRARIAALKDNWVQFEAGHLQLEKLVDGQTRAALEYFKELHFEVTEEVYQESWGAFMELLEELEPPVSHNESLNQSVNAYPDRAAFSLSHLPQIKLPPFEGNFAEWENFRDRFSSLIIANKSLNDFAKMHYLVSSLKGRALDSICNIPVTADNFPIAWSALTKRFENKRRLITTHFSTLFGLSAATRESASELQTLLDKITIAVAALRNLNRSPYDLWDDFLVHLLSQKIDSASRKAWNLKTSDADDPPNFESLRCFLASRIRALEECNPSPSTKGTKPNQNRLSVATASASPNPCPVCKDRHYLNHCKKFLAQNPSQRRETVKTLKRCFNCLCASHSVLECKSKHSCRTCSKRHHSLLHLSSDSDAKSADSVVTESTPSISNSVSEVTSLSAATDTRSRSNVLLATARVRISSTSGRSIIARALLDQGSEATFISESLAQSLRIKRIRMPVVISAVGGTQAATVRHAAAIRISPESSDQPSFTTTALILPTLTSYSPKRSVNPSALTHLSHLSWADPNPTSTESINLLIGADLYSELIQDGVQKGQPGQPIAQNSALGWIISGPLQSSAHPASLQISVHHCTPLMSLNEDIKKFWEIEELPKIQILSPDEQQCESHFSKTHSRSVDGRYIVRLPFRRDPPIDIGHTRQKAERLLRNLIRRFQTQLKLKEDYTSFMREYAELGHMRRAPNNSSSQQAVFIPHHPVFRADSTTSKIRVVFNASSVSSNGTSLNDHLLAGPKLQLDLSSILLKWRQFRFVYSADVAKMYRQILVDERDLDFQRILWIDEDSSEPHEHQLLTVTYGMTCAPYLALRVLKSLTENDGHRFPLAAPVVQNQIYVDDVLFGDNDLNSLRQRRDQLIGLMRTGKFELRKWASNSADLLSDIDPSDHGLACSKSIATDEKVKILGIVWNPALDNFQFRVIINPSIPNTKREILSSIAKLFDPLGWVSPVVVSAKIFMQELWLAKLDWDDEIPDALLTRWSAIYSKLPNLNEVSIPRWTRVHPDVQLELHGFADASSNAYAAVVYLRVLSPSGNISVSLLSSKSKVAPVKSLTIPRLELCAAFLLSQLMRFIINSLDLQSVITFLWTDSTIVLTWLRSHPARWTTFVANRVSKIQENLPNAAWRYVPTSSNPADCASRGLLADELLSHRLWWHGPPWLVSPSADWPSEPEQMLSAPLEEKVKTIHVTQVPDRWDLANRYSSWLKLIHVTGYLFKFIFACRRLSDRTVNCALSPVDCNRARAYWLKQAQSDVFSKEIQALKAKRPLSPKSFILSLNPFLDPSGVLRVGGRLSQAPLPYDTRHPILLARHPVVNLIVSHAHIRALHGGTQLTLSILRKEYWILRARGLVRTIINSCLPCVRERAATPTQMMGDLPAVRLTPPCRCFAHTGVDYAGPMKVRASSGRGIKSHKAYIALFVCLSTRAIHLELVSDLSTSAFLSAFKRFCSRRGLPQSVYSDNGTTFMGADRELTASIRSATRDPNFVNLISSDKISWHFIPPSAPHFGGMWEAGVKSVKHHLKRVLGSHSLSFEELTTLLCQIEACLNSRPIAPVSDDADDYQFLTPGHFLIGSSLTVPPEPSTLNLNENRLSRWQLVGQLGELFWGRWTRDYINTLQQRKKWRKIQPALAIGRLVMIQNSFLPPCKWELGRITATHPGKDGLIRVVSVKTAHSEYVRPIGKICPLPVECASST